jgi:hypothetical protein
VNAPPNELQFKLVAYMDSATDLAESVRTDLVRNGKISEKTVLSLLAFVKSAENVQKFVDLLYKEVRTYN